MSDLKPIHISEEEITASLTFEEVIGEVRDAYLRQWESPECNVPRQRIKFDGGIYHTMSAYSMKYGIVGSKCYLTMKGAEPSFKMLVFDTATGKCITFDADFIGRLRTAASTILAVRHFAPNSEDVALIGAGRQGSMHLGFMRLLPAVKQVTIFSKTDGKVGKLIAEAQPGSPFRIKAGQNIDSVSRQAQVAILTTYSKEPILYEKHLHDGLRLICATGANYKSRSEVEEGIFKKARLLVVDDTETAQIEGADIGKAVDKLYIQWKDLTPFGEALAKNIAPDKGLVIFKSYGINALDIAVAGLYLRKNRLLSS